MRAISLWQPWGSLWLRGVKLHETRHWHIRRQWTDWQPGDRLAVHAAKRFEKDHDTELAEILRRTFGLSWVRDLPVGALIGTIAVTACTPTDSVFAPGSYSSMTEAERADFHCGDFSADRYAWLGASPIIFPKPIPYAGSQGIFSVADDVILAASRAA